MNRRLVGLGVLALLLSAVLGFIIAPLTPLNGTIMLILTVLFAVGGLVLIAFGVMEQFR